MRTLVIALVSIALSVCGQFALRAGMTGARVRAALDQGSLAQSILGVLSDRYVLLGFLLYVLGALAWLAVLAQWEVSKSYPMVGMGFVLTLVIAASLLGETVGPQRWLGAALIVAGVVVISRS